MNHVTNDYGQTVIAVGAPGSIERVKVERPKLIDQLNSLYFQAYDSPGRAVDEAVEMMRADGIRSELETSSLLKSSHYGEERPGSVTDLVCSIANATHDWREPVDTQFCNEKYTEVKCTKCGMVGEKTIATGEVFFPAT